MDMHLHIILVKHVSVKNVRLGVKLVTITKSVILVMMVMEWM
jgi:hypothetical protein